MTVLPVIARADRHTAPPFLAGNPDSGATPANAFAALLNDEPDSGETAQAALPKILAPVLMTMAETSKAEGAVDSSAAVLTLANLQHSSLERLFSFSELGMFGRNASQIGPAPDQVAPYEAADADTIETAIWPGQSPALQQSMLEPAVFRPGEQEAGAAQSRRGEPVSLFAQSGPVASAEIGLVPLISALPSGDDGETFSLGGLGTVARMNLSAQQSPRANPVSVSVSGSDEALTIVARAGGADPVQIRRLIEAAAAEFDASVAELHFNGSTTEPAFPSAIGGNHGSRSR